MSGASELTTALVKHLISELADPEALDLAAGLIADRLAGKADVPDVAAAIEQARKEWAPLFRASSAAVIGHQAPAGTTAHGIEQANKQRREAEALEAVLRASGGNTPATTPAGSGGIGSA